MSKPEIQVFEFGALIIRALKPGRLHVLEKRGSGRQSCGVEKSVVEHPVANRRIINRVAAFERAVIIARVEQVN